MKAGGIKTWKKLAIGVQQLVRLLSNNNFINPGLVLLMRSNLLLYNSFILSQFNYCPLIWMFCGKVVNNELNRTHKRALRILFNDYTSTFNELLHRGNECTIHQKNLLKLMLEVYNSLIQQNPSILWDVFHEKDNNYNLRSRNLLMLPRTKTTTYGNDSLSFVVACYGIPCRQ